MQNTPLVSAIIPAYNAELYVREAVESALTQSHEAMEVIVVNDGSSDGTGAVIESFGDRVHYIRKRNGGVATARNAGIRAAKGDYLAFLDADDRWHQGKIARQLELMESHDGAGLVYVASRDVDDSGVPFAGSDAPPPKDTLYTHHDILDMVFKNPVGSPSGVMVSRPVIDRVGGFDETFLNGSEDWEFYLRVVEQFAIVMSSEVLYDYRVHSDGLCNPKNAETMLKTDLMLLDKVFSKAAYGRRWRTRRRAYSERYFAACKAFAVTERTNRLRHCLWQAFWCYPPSTLTKVHARLLAQSVLGNQGYESLRRLVPIPRSTQS